MRRSLGRIATAFGLLQLLPVAFVWLSSHGPAPARITARAWSLFFYAHFVALVCSGLGFQAARSAREGVFHGGPLLDFLVGVAAFMLVESLCAAALRRGEGASWPALLPGLFLIAFGLRLRGGAPLFKG